MTSIRTINDFIDELHDLKQTKDNPDEWYVLSGRHVGEYSIQDADKPAEYDEAEADLPPENRDATENVDGFYQIGTVGWSAEAFADGVNFVGITGFSDSFDRIDRRVNGLLLVHESQLSEKALDIANDRPEAPADD